MSAAEPAIKVMSFNIRYGAANDGENSWPKRSHLVLETIQMFGPDLLGTQEVIEFQADFLKENLVFLAGSWDRRNRRWFSLKEKCWFF